jgi:hypothetical protein
VGGSELEGKDKAMSDCTVTDSLVCTLPGHFTPPRVKLIQATLPTTWTIAQTGG